jgi:hypothetical protein
MSSQSVTVREATDIKPGDLAALEVEGVRIAIANLTVCHVVPELDTVNILFPQFADGKREDVEDVRRIQRPERRVEQIDHRRWSTSNSGSS